MGWKEAYVIAANDQSQWNQDSDGLFFVQC